MVNLEKVRERARKRKDNLEVILSTMKEQLKEVSDIISDTKVQSGYRGNVEVEYQDYAGDKFYYYLKVVTGRVVLVDNNDNFVANLHDILNENKHGYTLRHFDISTLVDAWIEFVNEHLTKLNTLRKTKEKLVEIEGEIEEAQEEL